jgi:hypothetical protein
MRPLPDRLNDELERQRLAPSTPTQETQPWPASDSEVEELVALAHRLQQAPQLRVDPTFARRLEEQMLARSAALHRQPRHRRFAWPFPRLMSAHPALSGALALLLLVILLGGSVLAAAAQVADPTNPLYAVKHWEQQVQVSLAGSSTAQAELDLQFARDRLSTLAGLADPGHAGAYRQALAELDEQLHIAFQAVAALPAGPDHSRLSGELAALQADARQSLLGLLPRLAVPERLATTDELGRLGGSVPRLTSVVLTLPAHPNGQATISISGNDLQPGAQLLVNGQPVLASGTLQNGLYLFTVNWKGSQHPQSIGLMNPDGTAAQTTTITLRAAPGSSGSGNGNGNGSGNGNGNGGNGSNGSGSSNSNNGSGNGRGSSSGNDNGHNNSSGGG